MRLKNKKNKLLPILLAVIVVASLFFTAYKVGLLNNFFHEEINDTDTNTVRDTNDIDYTGPTESDISNSQAAKSRAGSTSTLPPSPNSGSKRTISIAVSYADINSDNQLEVRAFTSDIIEGSGTCTLTASKGSSEVTTNTPAFIDVSSTICEPLYIPKSKLSTGTWKIVVTYSSPNASGTSGQSQVGVM